jgi:hypothetical protein
MLTSPLNSSYPLKPLQIDDLLLFHFSITHSCSINGTQDYYFFNSSIPKTERDGFAFSFHDPFEVISKDASTFSTIDSQRMRLKITPKVKMIDESLRAVDLSM